MEKAVKKVKKSVPLINKIIPTILITPIVIAAIIIIFVQLSKVDANATVATVNNEPICIAELKNEMQIDRSDTISYFQSKGITVGKKFWTTKYGGQTPAEYLRQVALNKMKRINVEQILAKKSGIVSDISYKNMIKEFEQENQRRALAVKNSQPIYGVAEFTIGTYFTDKISKLEISLKAELAKSGGALESNDTNLKAHYEATKDVLYKKLDTFTLKSFSFDYIVKGKPTKISEKDANAKMQEVLLIINGNA